MRLIHRAHDGAYLRKRRVIRLVRKNSCGIVVTEDVALIYLRLKQMILLSLNQDGRKHNNCRRYIRPGAKQ